ncbi:hypothetical protein pclt_cds_1106 [Pandoravirus celtis]|uniref:Uncharacterized protein n=1 Tax=Pandoravirus celtis TaxID=2568002 RepID=A0A4D6EKM6_9VIRU|nr:hypothetical protein pclt_cds_1106 [Pandoravirus celtis]
MARPTTGAWMYGGAWPNDDDEIYQCSDDDNQLAGWGGLHGWDDCIYNDILAYQTRDDTVYNAIGSCIDHNNADDGTWGNGDDDVSGLGECPVAPKHTPYAYGYTFIEGFMPADSFDALVRPERRLVVVVGGVPVALDAAEVERAGNVGRPLATPLGSCSLGPLDVERAHEADEALYEREGLRRFLTTAPVTATIEAAAPALGAGAGAAADVAGGSILAGVLGGLFAAVL